MPAHIILTQNRNRKPLVLLVLALAVMLGACTTSSYNMPQEETTRTYTMPMDTVFTQAVEAVTDAKFALVRADRDDLEIRGRKGMTMTSWRGFHLMVTLVSMDNGVVKVHAAVEEAGSQATDWGSSQAYVKKYLNALDTRLKKVEG